MRIVAPAEVGELVQERGGRLFVWLDAARCCGPMTYLKTSSSPPKKPRPFTLLDAEGFELYLDAGHLGQPDELRFEIKGWRTKRIEAYWNGCLWAG